MAYAGSDSSVCVCAMLCFSVEGTCMDCSQKRTASMERPSVKPSTGIACRSDRSFLCAGGGIGVDVLAKRE